jgi:predicted phosphoadenosine phosphosulfate sulfurtransferase
MIWLRIADQFSRFRYHGMLPLHLMGVMAYLQKFWICWLKTTWTIAGLF